MSEIVGQVDIVIIDIHFNSKDQRKSGSTPNISLEKSCVWVLSHLFQYKLYANSSFYGTLQISKIDLKAKQICENKNKITMAKIF